MKEQDFGFSGDVRPWSIVNDAAGYAISDTWDY